VRRHPAGDDEDAGDEKHDDDAEDDEGACRILGGLCLHLARGDGERLLRAGADVGEARERERAARRIGGLAAIAGGRVRPGARALAVRQEGVVLGGVVPRGEAEVEEGGGGADVAEDDAGVAGVEVVPGGPFCDGEAAAAAVGAWSLRLAAFRARGLFR